MKLPPALAEVADAHPYPLVFATVSGAHLYGFPSPDSDWDLRGCHVMPAREVLRLRPPQETIEAMRDNRPTGGVDLDLVSHDIAKFFRLMLKNNGYVLEQLHSPIVVRTTPAHDELKQIASGVVTRHHAHHYLGFAATQWKLFNKGTPKVKPLLYLYRVLLTGLHLMKTGKIEANLVVLNREAKLSWIEELVERKLTGDERQTLADADLAFHERQYHELRARLEAAFQSSHLREKPTAQSVAALDRLLVDLRLGNA
jgi:predicted nucleotidyltransferase